MSDSAHRDFANTLENGGISKTVASTSVIKDL